MKFLCERDALKDALASVIGRTKGIKNMPILEHILFETGPQSITLTGHDLGSCSQAKIAAEVSGQVAIALPADRLHKLIGGLPTGGQITFHLDGMTAKLRSGRSTYQFNTLPASDFPTALTVEGGTSIMLNRDQVKRIFKTTAACASTEETRYYLNGIYLHRDKGRLTAAATDGHVLVRTYHDKVAEDFGIIVPNSACDEIARLGAEHGVELKFSSTLIAATFGDRSFVSKLIDGTFPDYNMAIPNSAAPAVTIDTADMEAALARLAAAQDPESKRVIRLEVPARAERLIASMITGLGRGEEQIECDASEREQDAHIAFLAENLRILAGATDCKKLRLYIDGPHDPMRVEDPDNRDLTAVCVSYRL